ncbi:LacI family DNA-binding transcriptional regulator [Arthrobacter pigmenti]
MSRSATSRPTVPDVARAAGVSTSTAARALGGYGYVSANVQERVHEAAAKLGYRTNQVAKSMVTGRTNTIGVVGADIENPYFAGSMRGIGDMARATNYGAILTNSDEDVAIERDAVQILVDRGVDGLIVAPADVSDCSHLVMAMERGVPVTLLDRTCPGTEMDAVIIDNVKAAKEAITHLIELGHRRIGIVTELRREAEAYDMEKMSPGQDIDPLTLNPSASRLLGYLQAHWDADLPVDPTLLGRTKTYTKARATSATIDLLKSDDPPTAIFSVDNLMTIGALEGMKKLDAHMPEELSLVAFDDLDWMTLVTPSITAVRQPVYEMGMNAAQILFSRINNPDRAAIRSVASSELIIRNSSGPPHTSPESRVFISKSKDADSA